MISSNLDPDDETSQPSDPKPLDPLPQTSSEPAYGSNSRRLTPRSPTGITVHLLPRLALSENRHQLTEADMQLCKRLMTRVIEHFTPILFTPATTPHMSCTDVFADTWMPLVISPAIGDNGVYKPIETLERMKEIDWDQHGLCATCVVEKREEWTEEQGNIWTLVDKWLEEESII